MLAVALHRLLGLSRHDPAPALPSLPVVGPRVVPGRDPNPGIHDELPARPRPRRSTPETRIRDAVDHIDALLLTVPPGGSEAAALRDVRMILEGSER